MHKSSSVNRRQLLPPVVHPELDAAALPTSDRPYLGIAGEQPDPTILAPYLTIGAHLVRLAF